MTRFVYDLIRKIRSKIYRKGYSSRLMHGSLGAVWYWNKFKKPIVLILLFVLFFGNTLKQFMIVIFATILILIRPLIIVIFVSILSLPLIIRIEIRLFWFIIIAIC